MKPNPNWYKDWNPEYRTLTDLAEENITCYLNKHKDNCQCVKLKQIYYNYWIWESENETK